MKIEEVADCAVRMRFAENYSCLLLWIVVWLVVEHYFCLQLSVLKMSKILFVGFIKQYYLVKPYLYYIEYFNAI